MAESLDDSNRLRLLRPALKGKPGRATSSVWIFNCLVDMLESGEMGRQAVLAALEDAIRLSYGFTK